MERKNSIIGSLQLLLTAFIWGVGFVAQARGSELLPPHTFNFSRNVCAFIFLVVLLTYYDKKRGEIKLHNLAARMNRAGGKPLLIGGVICGSIVFLGLTFQQIGVEYTTVGKAGFITAMYVVIVPVIGIFIGEKIGIKMWAGVVISVIGLYMLCVKEAVTINIGDILLAGSAFTYAFQIVIVHNFLSKVDGVWLSCIQFFIVTIISFVAMMMFEEPHIDLIFSAWKPIFFAGIMSSGVGYTLQIVGQQKVRPEVAALILSLEAVFSALAGWIMMNQILTPVELTGAALILVAVIMAQLPDGISLRKKGHKSY